MLRLLRYIALVCEDMHLGRFRATLEKLAPTAEVQAMTTIAEQLRAEGHIEGKLEGKLESIMMLLRGRQLIVTDEQRARIESCTDPDTLDRWLLAAATVADTAELFEG